jgi:hypothetical protein
MFDVPAPAAPTVMAGLDPISVRISDWGRENL